MPLSAGATPWEKFKNPTTAQPQAIGSYSNGCLAGASVLPAQGEGYQRVRAERGRYYGHESMIAFLEELSGKAHKLKLGNLLVSDIAMPRGGRFRSGHASHQTGLDADIWLTTLAQPATEEELSSLQPLPMVDLKAYRILSENWSENQANLIQLAAADDRVARIFVHPVIKEQLCAVQWTDRDWLRKVRPWWGHYYHFHVRLHCPQGNRDCKEQRPPPTGDGCGAELASWKPKPASERKVAAAKPAKKRPPLIPVQHPGCMAMLNGPAETQGQDHYAAGEPTLKSSQRAQ
ncbi:penicillin-insensitive murein endopeptidase [Photobacterium sp. GJ3]|uniref:penicillin-insensitive murein endopeptidase n=1 Tax=Photobacterium sp. GJ3 TaxID=2829502 RepID=UPI001B8AF0A3|nr:penicillin-insensitive murein endopeptidase [Photobacterium sp. GJ3]QUJ69024.1 penicillin-insensitive murein endopeptidase [Photobacterium sp. GJ3]